MEEYTYTIPADSACIEPLQEEITLVLQARGIRLRQIQAILLALGEWLEKLAQREPAGSTPHPVQVDLAVETDEVRLVVTDTGSGFDPGLIAAGAVRPPGDPRPETDRTVLLITHLMDAVSYRHTEGRNRLEMCKRVLARN